MFIDSTYETPFPDGDSVTIDDASTLEDTSIFIQAKFKNFDNSDQKFMLHLKQCWFQDQICNATVQEECDWKTVDNGHDIIVDGCLTNDGFVQRQFGITPKF